MVLCMVEELGYQKMILFGKNYNINRLICLNIYYDFREGEMKMIKIQEHSIKFKKIKKIEERIETTNK